MEVKPKSCLVSIAIFLVVLLGAFFGVLLIFNRVVIKNPNNRDNPGLFGRVAMTEDILFTDRKFSVSSLGQKFTFNPKYDIDDLKITFEFSKDDRILQKVEKNIGNVKSGTMYDVTVSAADFNADVILNAASVTGMYYVSGGTTSIFNKILYN